MIFGIVFLCGAAVGVAAYRWGMQVGLKVYEQGMNRQKYALFPRSLSGQPAVSLP